MVDGVYAKMLINGVALEEGTSKLNVDVSISLDVNSFSIEMMLHDYNEKFMGGKNMRAESVVSIFEVEAIRVCKAFLDPYATSSLVCCN